MQVRVKLPSGPLIHYLKFCRAIAEAVCPIDKDIEGIKCVWAKIYPPDVLAPYSGTGVPYSLDETDRHALANVLPKLPPLRYPMSEEKAASFIEAYVNLPDCPIWLPLLVTEEAIRARKAEQTQVMDRHLETMREERKAGRLVAVDTKHVPLDAVQIGAHLPRQDAIAYLVRHGLAYDSDEMAKSPEHDALSSKAAHQAGDVDPLALSGRKNAVGVPRVSAARRTEALKRCKELKDAGVRDFVAQSAKECGVTSRTINKWTNNVKKEKESMWPLGSTISQRNWKK